MNLLAITRDTWPNVGTTAGVPAIEIEVLCSDPAEHRHRVTSTSIDIPDLSLPDWWQVLDRDHEPWGREHIIVETAGQERQESLASLLRHLEHPTPSLRESGQQ
ncbi:hypothetical protein [Streptomyces tauricus]|uniref:hypothetical protein n=1 Tax=Streptomyces tauricus TaxID=68274 RepID=UPI00380D7B38